MKKTNLPLWVALITVLVTTACLSSLPSPTPAPATSATPDLVLTGRAQTLTSVPTLTATPPPILATETATITLTPFPSITPLPTATATATNTPFGFVPSKTPSLITEEAPTTDSADGATNDWGSDYRCTLVEKSPKTGETLAAASMYKASWTLFNSGQKVWQADGVKVAYLSGDRLALEKEVSLVRDVKVGQSTRVVVTFGVPKEPGRYRSVWALIQKRGGKIFCTFTINVVAE